ncbi:MAG: SHOCT domain-containing protein [Acidimicrobiales bacterium]
MAMFFLLFFWIFILIQIIIDIFRSHDMGGFAKALWLIGILIFPLLGVLIYLIARGGKMHERQIEAAQAQQKAMNQYIKETASSGSSADELAKLADLKSKGVLSDAEFEAQKAKLLS